MPACGGCFPPNDAFADMIICDRIYEPDCKSEQLREMQVFNFI